MWLETGTPGRGEQGDHRELKLVVDDLPPVIRLHSHSPTSNVGSKAVRISKYWYAVRP